MMAAVPRMNGVSETQSTQSIVKPEKLRPTPKWAAAFLVVLGLGIVSGLVGLTVKLVKN
ncbi:hypothetical protein PF010_g26088 [Phytophthora fragariae]|nr:hypothetical protein PF010_g26088 [Phytophthora fragariae]